MHTRTNSMQCSFVRAFYGGNFNPPRATPANYLSQNMKPQKFMKSRWLADFHAIYISRRKEERPAAISPCEK